MKRSGVKVWAAVGAGVIAIACGALFSVIDLGCQFRSAPVAGTDLSERRRDSRLSDENSAHQHSETTASPEHVAVDESKTSVAPAKSTEIVPFATSALPQEVAFQKDGGLVFDMFVDESHWDDLVKVRAETRFASVPLHLSSFHGLPTDEMIAYFDQLRPNSLDVHWQVLTLPFLADMLRKDYLESLSLDVCCIEDVTHSAARISELAEGNSESGLKELTLRRLNFQDEEPWKDVLPKLGEIRLPHLQSLTLIECQYPELLVSAFASSPHLRTLKVIGSEVYGRQRLFDAIAQTHITELEIDSPTGLAGGAGDRQNAQGVRALAKVTGLKSLTISNCSGLRDEDLAALADLAHLRELHLSRCDSGIRGVFLSNLSAPSQLSALTLNHCTNLDLKNLSGLHELKRLNLTEIQGAKHQLDFMESLHRLEELTLSLKGQRFLESNARSLVRASDGGSLRVLDTSGMQMASDLTAEALSRLRGVHDFSADCTKLSEVGVSALMALPNLTSLSLANVSALSRASLEMCASKRSVESLTLIGATALEGLGSLKDWQSLRRLRLVGSSMGSELLERIGSLHQLEIVEFDTRQLTSEHDLSPLSRMKGLKGVVLHAYGEFEQTGILSLAAALDLRFIELHLHRYEFRDWETLTHMRRALPDCRIEVFEAEGFRLN